jgi:4-carboxymuconolactone decarboxylase
VNYQDRLLQVALRLTDGTTQPAEKLTGQRVALDPKTVALARLAALIAMGGPVPSYSELVDAAVDVGATPTDTVDVLVAIVDIVGSPRAADAAPKLAMALGFDIDKAMEANSEPRLGLSAE